MIALHDTALRLGERSLKVRGTSIHLSTAPVTEPAYVSALEAEFWEFESPLGHQFFLVRFFSGCSVNLVDGLPWKQEAAGSNPATQTIVFLVFTRV